MLLFTISLYGYIFKIKKNIKNNQYSNSIKLLIIYCLLLIEY